VLAAIAEWEVLTTFGWAALYGPDALVPATYAARTRLVLAGRARAEADAYEEQMADAPSADGGRAPAKRPRRKRTPAGVAEAQSGTRTTRGANGTTTTEHVAVVEGPARRRSALDQMAAG
jgi:hypothetical protein